MKNAYVLLRTNKEGLWDVILKGKHPKGKVAYFRNEAAARKVQRKFKRFGVYLISKV